MQFDQTTLTELIAPVLGSYLETAFGAMRAGVCARVTSVHHHIRAWESKRTEHQKQVLSQTVTQQLHNANAM